MDTSTVACAGCGREVTRAEYFADERWLPFVDDKSARQGDTCGPDCDRKVPGVRIPVAYAWTLWRHNMKVVARVISTLGA